MANRQIRDPGQLSRFEASGRISADVPSYAVYTGQAAEKLAQVAGNMADSLGQLADKAARREGALEGLSYAQKQGASFLQAQSVTGGPALSGPWMEQAKALLRKEEGFRDTPYFDVNAHRVGYGSDTHVTADGRIVPVTKDTRISREDAERDLTYRLSEREGAQVRKQLGDRWGTLPDSAKAALVSVGYNYGSLPGAVVAAAKTGDLQQLAAAVGGLPANPGRRKREAAMIAGATGTPSTDIDPITTASTTPASAPLSTTPLALRRDGTIRGEAFDDAALSAWGWRMQEGVSNALFAAQQENEDNPAGYAAAAKSVYDQFAKEIGDPVGREMFEKSFAQDNQAYVKNVTANHERKLRQEQELAFSGGLSARQVDIERQAQVLGANPDGDQIIGDQVAKIHRSIDGAVAQGIISPAQAAKQKEEIAKTAARGRIQGVFDALPNPQQKEQFALGLLDEWISGKGVLAELPFDTVKGISNVLANKAIRQRERGATADKAEQQRVRSLIKDDVASISETGQGLDPDKNAFTPETVRTAVGETDFAKWQDARDRATTLYRATAGMEGQSADQIAERLAVMEPRPGTVGYADAKEVFDNAVAKGAAVLKDREKDPLLQANAAGLIALAPIDATTPETMSQSLLDRSKQVETVAGTYGITVPMFTSAEVRALKAQSLSQDPATQTAVMTQLDYLSSAEGALAVKQQIGADALDRLQDWQGRLRYMSGDEMSAWLKDRADPKWNERVKPLVEKGVKEARKVSFDDVLGELDSNMILDAGAPIDPDAKAMMLEDYVTLVGDRFASTQDIDAAKSQAIERMKKVWGVTSAYGERGGRVMLYPPEAHYPPVANSFSYITDEVATIAAGRGVDASAVSLVSDGRTEAAVDRGELPGYLISIIDPKSGRSELAIDERGHPLRHTFDVDGARANALAAAEKERRERSAPWTSLGMSEEGKAEAERTRNDPWLVLGEGTAIGPLYFGQTPQEAESRKRRIKEILTKGRGSQSALQRVEDYERENGPGQGPL